MVSLLLRCLLSLIAHAPSSWSSIVPHACHGLQAYIDWKSIRENVDYIKANVANRNSKADPDRVVDLYDRWRHLQTQAEDLRTERNANAKAMKVTLQNLSEQLGIILELKRAR